MATGLVVSEPAMGSGDFLFNLVLRASRFLALDGRQALLVPESPGSQ